MIIRPATINDIDALVAVVESSFNACVAPGYSPEGVTFFLLNSDDRYFSKRLKGDALILVAEDDKGIYGMIEIRDGNHICRFFVLPERQQRGVGRKLFDAAVNACRARIADLHEMTVHASPNAVPAYGSLGFTPTDDERTANGMRYVSMVRKL